MADIKAIAETLVNLTIKEASELATILEEEYGIKPAAAAVAVAGPAAGAGDGAAEEEQTEFDVILTGLQEGAKKVGVIKVVRSLVSGVSLGDAKAMVDEPPTTLKEGVTKDEAEDVKKQLEEAGATVEIK